jgi:hypothetical protein
MWDPVKVIPDHLYMARASDAHGCFEYAYGASVEAAKTLLEEKLKKVLRPYRIYVLEYTYSKVLQTEMSPRKEVT